MSTLSKYQETLDPISEAEALLDHLVPSIVGAYGGTVSHSDTVAHSANPADYQDLADLTAQLLGFLGVTDIREGVVEQAKSKWSKSQNPWVVLGNRVEMLHQEYRLQGDIPWRAEQLWATLEARCKELTGETFKDVLGL